MSAQLKKLLGKFNKLFVKIPVFILAGVLIILYLLTVLLFLTEPSSKVQNVLFSNVTDHQITISWTTSKPTRGEILVSGDGKFPLLAVFSKKVKDDGEKMVPTRGIYTTHHLTIPNLEPNKQYHFRIYQGLRLTFSSTFQTAPALNSINMPNPVYGKVVDKTKKGVVGAIVYFQAINESSKSAILSTLTNKEGGWSIDLGNLRSFNLKDSFKIKPQTSEQVVVEAGARGRVKLNSKSGADKPWPDIIL